MSNDIEALKKELYELTMANGELSHKINLLASERQKEIDRADFLEKACQIMMGAIGDEEGYLPSLGASKTDQIRQLMRKAGVEPVYYKP